MSAAKSKPIALPDLLLALIMCAFVLVPLVCAGWFGSRSAVSTIEKRKLASLPPWPTSIGEWIAYPKAFDAFATDHFGFRPQLLDGYKWIVAGIFHDSVSSEAFVGRHHWLYLSVPHVLADMRGVDPYSDAALVNAVQQINARGELLAVRRIRYGFVVFPDKHTVYPQYLPRGLYAGFDGRRLIALDAAMADTGHGYYVDTSNALRAEAPASPMILYYKTDTHWDPWGAYLGYRAWVAADGPRLGLKPITYRLDQFRAPLHHVDGGDLSLMSGYKTHDIGLRPPLDAVYKSSTSEISAKALQQLHIMPSHFRVAVGAGSGDALVLHDSFMDYIDAYVAAGYKYSWLVWAYPGDTIFGWLVDKSKPDVVLVERVERMMATFPRTDIPALVRNLGVIGQPAQVDDTGRLRIGSSGKDAYARPPRPVTATVDQVTRAGRLLRVAGWARIGERSPDAIVVAVHGKVVAEAPVTLRRRDVALSLKNPRLIWSGFRVNIPVNDIRAAGDTLRIYFVNFDDYGAYQVPNALMQRLRTMAGKTG
jgi:hypothetical protein